MPAGRGGWADSGHHPPRRGWLLWSPTACKQGRPGQRHTHRRSKGCWVVGGLFSGPVSCALQLWRACRYQADSMQQKDTQGVERGREGRGHATHGQWCRKKPQADEVKHTHMHMTRGRLAFCWGHCRATTAHHGKRCPRSVRVMETSTMTAVTLVLVLQNWSP